MNLIDNYERKQTLISITDKIIKIVKKALFATITSSFIQKRKKDKSRKDITLST